MSNHGIDSRRARAIRRFLAERDGSDQCHWCRKAEGTTIDHVRSIWAGGGRLDRDNMVLACLPCNEARGRHGRA